MISVARPRSLSSGAAISKCDYNVTYLGICLSISTKSVSINCVDRTTVQVINTFLSILILAILNLPLSLVNEKKIVLLLK